MRIDEFKRELDNGTRGFGLVNEYIKNIDGALFPVNFVEFGPSIMGGAGGLKQIEAARAEIRTWCSENLRFGWKLGYFNSFTVLMCEHIDDAVIFKLRWVG